MVTALRLGGGAGGGGVQLVGVSSNDVFEEAILYCSTKNLTAI